MMKNRPFSLQFGGSVAAMLVAFASLGLIAGGPAGASPVVRIGAQVVVNRQGAPTTSDCQAILGVPCYGPQQIRTAYGLNSLINGGWAGFGQTIVLIESYGSPTLEADLKQFDADFGLPDPPSLTVLAPLGTVPFDPTNPEMISWAFETTLDVEWAHAMAPGAKIVVLTSPVAETQGVQGLPEFLALETYALDHHLGTIISQSWATAENTLFTQPGRDVIAAFSALYERARNERVTVLASAGDFGSANPEPDGTTFYPFPTVSFPASSPLVTAVGGTSLSINNLGIYQSESVWNNAAGAGGGGVSQVFQTPDYQKQWLSPSTRAALAGHRGIPDVSFNADSINSAILVYISAGASVGIPAGYYLIGGTSEGAPSWAGIVADLNQYAGVPLGFLNPALYALGGRGLFHDFGHDVTVGNNSFAGVPGYNATVGWDLATGWGTPEFNLLPARWWAFNGR
jgi:subtilase family serine protease